VQTIYIFLYKAMFNIEHLSLIFFRNENILQGKNFVRIQELFLLVFIFLDIRRKFWMLDRTRFNFVPSSSTIVKKISIMVITFNVFYLYNDLIN